MGSVAHLGQCLSLKVMGAQSGGGEAGRGERGGDFRTWRKIIRLDFAWNQVADSHTLCLSLFVFLLSLSLSLLFYTRFFYLSLSLSPSPYRMHTRGIMGPAPLLHKGRAW
jgi:hypothetical protein